MAGLISVFGELNERRVTWLQIDAAGLVTGFNGHVDLGTGIGTALSQIVAEELDLPLAAVRIVLGDTGSTPDQGPTIASETIQVAALPLRQAAAQLRHYLFGLAARRLNAPPEALRAQDGALSWPEAGRVLTYAELVADQDVAMRLDPSLPQKDPRDYRLVGQPVGRIDLPEKVTGAFAYIHDIRIEGMVHGHVIRPPYAGRDSGAFIGNSLLSYDEGAVAQMPGFLAVIRIADFLGVVAETASQAEAIAEALPVRWVMPPDLPPLEDLRHALKAAPSTPRLLDCSGDFAAGLAGAAHRLDRTYIWPYHEHGSIGPSCAVADWNDGRPLVWSGSQNPHMLQGDLAKLTGIAPDLIEIRRYQAAGCYGRNCADDVCGDALLLSRAVAKPVRVQLTRAQEHLWEPKGAAQLMEVSGGISAGGETGSEAGGETGPDAGAEVCAYGIESWYPSNRGPNLALLLTGRVPAEPHHAMMGDRTIIPPYRIAHKRVICHDIAPIVRAAWMRGVSALPNTFAHESWMDEAAAMAGADPVAFRLRHLDHDPRAADLVRRTAEAGGWQERSGPRLRREGRMAYGQGFAFATYVHGPFPGTAAAAAAWVCDVAVDTETGEVTLTRVMVGQDQGLVINPEGVRAQIHGNVIQTASRTLREELSFDAIAPVAKSWATYPIQSFEEVPVIRSTLIERPGDPALGVGESAAVPAAAAIANAIFDATGVRLREAPFTPEKMRQGLAAIPGAAALPAPARKPRKRQRLGAQRLGALARQPFAKAAAVIGGALTLGAWALPLHAPIAPVAAPAASTFSAATLARGREVFAAGDCAVCHTASGGVQNAGGRAMETPFGTVYSTNLTPDPETGLGLWSYAAFERAMRHGISRDGKNLYPVFPYTAFAKIDDQDMLALYAYLQVLEPVRQATPAAQMMAPVNIRAVNAGWNLLFHDAAPLTPDPAQSEAWNRGRYLVEGAGHCSACHTPRNLLGAEKTGAAALSGALVDGWWAPALAGGQIAGRGWSEAAFYSYLRDGHAPGIASAAGPMAEVVHSLKDLPDPDLQAMASYLASLAKPSITGPWPAPAAPEVQPLPETLSLASPGARLFRGACASCHAPGLPGSLTEALLPLEMSAALRAPVPGPMRSLLEEGITAPEGLDLREMPSFAGQFTESQTDELLAWLRARYAPDLPPWPGMPAQFP